MSQISINNQKQYKLKPRDKKAIGLLSIGTFLEYFDLMLYVHMAVLLNELFFPKTDAETAKLISAFTFCLTFVFRPVGALIFGYLGDTIGRKYTVIITTFLMALSCFIMTQVQTYAQIGIAASWIVSICRVVQGMCSMGEIMGAEIYIAESIKPPSRYPAAAFIILISKVGGSAALLLGTLVLFYGAGWRSAFAAGCIVALVGIIGRISLKETPEFLDSKNKLKHSLIEKDIDPDGLKKSKIYNHVNNNDFKSFIYYTLIGAVWPLWFYINYVHSSSILKSKYLFTSENIIMHNMIISFIEIFACSICVYLSGKIHPLKITKIKTYLFLPIAFLYPFLLDGCNSGADVFCLQIICVMFVPGSFPADSAMIPHFYVFKRFTYATLSYAISRGLVYCISSFGLIFLSKYFANIGLLIIIMPIMVLSIFGINYFISLEKQNGHYEFKSEHINN